MPTGIVLGAGIIGLSTALNLHERGWDVAVLDRRGVGLETSFGNAGIIQADMPEPSAMPREFGRLIAISAGLSNDIRYNFRELPRHAVALGHYWWHSRPNRHHRLSKAYAGLVAVAKAEHQRLIDVADSERFIRRDGYRVMFRAARSLDSASGAAARLDREYGLSFRLLSSADLAAAEPALRNPGLGAVQFLSAWTVNDPGGLAGAYADALIRGGGSVLHGDARSTRRTSAGWSIDTEQGKIEAEHLVVALGPWSPEFLRRFGGQVRMIPKRGYHTHISGPSLLDLLLVDADRGYLLAPMTQGLRITTGVHIASLGSPGDLTQLDRAETAARQLLNLGVWQRTATWMGTGPFMPGMLPVIGQSGLDEKLWMNFGHGHQGLTIGPSTGRLLAELMHGEQTFVEHAPFSPSRHGL